MNLGDMTGIELARALRADPATSGIRLVALSADALPEQIDAALAMGFEDYLTKPINFRDLLDVLGRTHARADPDSRKRPSTHRMMATRITRGAGMTQAFRRTGALKDLRELSALAAGRGARAPSATRGGSSSTSCSP